MPSRALRLFSTERKSPRALRDFSGEYRLKAFSRTSVRFKRSNVPGISVPSGLADEDGLPTGFQVLAPAMADDRLYRVGAALEAALLDRWGGPLLDKAPALAEKETVR